MTATSAMAIDVTALPDDPSLLKTMVRDLAALVVDLDGQKEYLLRQLYGRRSEKFVDPGQLTLGLEGEAAVATPAPAPPPASAEGPKETKPGHGRRPIPPGIRRVPVRHALPEAERICPRCEIPATKIGEEVSEQLDYVPAHFVARQDIREKYACQKCRKFVITAPLPPRPIEKGLPGPGLLSHVATCKYADHLPLYRLEGIFERAGIEISRSTLCDWIEQVAGIAEPIHVAMTEDVLRSKKVHADDTELPVLEEEKTGKTREGRIWALVGDEDHPQTVFHFTETRSLDGGVGDFLSNFAGYLQADADPRLDAPLKRGPIIEVGCWAHARRGFYDSRTSDPIRAHQALGLIKDLYAVEELGRSLDSKGRLGLRTERSKPILERFKEWLEVEGPKVLPKSPIGKAIGYALKQWEALSRFAEDGDLDIDNNVAERALRHVVKGRDNWTFAGSDAGGRRAAILFSLVMTCKRHGVDPFAYLRDILERVWTHPASRIEELFPHRWKELREKEPEAPRAP